MNTNAIVSRFLDRTTLSAALTELLGTFLLAFVAFQTGNAFAVGLTLLVLVYTIGDKSGAHVNPAVTTGLMFVGRFPFASGIVYIVFQVLGALLGRLAAWPVEDQLSPLVLATDTASIPPDGGFLGEFFGVVFLMFAVMAVVSGRVERSVSGLVIGIGFTVGLAATGGILNPAIGLVSLSLFGTIMPFLGAVVAAYLAVFALRNVRPPQS